ncbi:MAG TPA: hypothetical protein VMI13_07560 [Solirubrobacteraceae bacterium]|nr:hypothetical protein [Solirubrobacteraceae bacterium]
MITRVPPRHLVVILTAFALARPLLAQCPDGTPPPCGGHSAHAPSVAVLFMEPRSRNAADSLLAEGLTLEIINTLGGVTRLDVRSQWVSRAIAADADPKGLQVAVARDVAATVVGQLLPAELARLGVQRVDPRAKERLLTARALFEQYTAAAIRQALVLTQQAIAIDSGCAPAWVQLAMCYIWLRSFEPDSDAAYRNHVKTASERAFSLDSSNGAAMSIVAANRAARNDLSPHTEALARRAAAQEPGVLTELPLGFVLLSFGKEDEALAIIRDAVRRDSLSPWAWATAASRLSDARHFVEAAAAWERALALRPSVQDSVSLLTARRWARLETGDCTGSLAAGRSVQDTWLIIESLRCLGRMAEADSLIDGQLALSKTSPWVRAIYLAWRDRPDSAFAVLDRAFPSFLGLLLIHPAFDPYRQHPAYVALRRRMELMQ